METDATLVDEAPPADLARAGFHLVVMSPDEFLTLPLPEAGTLVIGRSSEAQVRLEDRLASRRHAVLHVGVDFFVEDAASANGTRVRDEACRPHQRVRIDPGEAIVIGSTVLMVQHNRAAARKPAARGPCPPPTPEPGSSLGPEMRRVRELAERAATSSINVLILGETGVGKEVLARAIVGGSGRDGKPFVAINCAGLADSLVESELFGHEKGAFTGALAAKMGLLESANGGVVFLDEVGETPLPIQAKLLRVIETREVLPVGGLRPRPLDVRFLAATNRDLEAEVLKGTFRRDLYFRLNGLSLLIPPLCARLGELELLAQVFLDEGARQSGRPAPRLAARALEALRLHAWPGNIRELKNVMERALLLCDGDTVDLAHLPLVELGLDLAASPPVPATTRANADVAADADDETDPGTEDEKARILRALHEHAGNQTRAAMALGMPRRTFVTRLDRYGIQRPRK